MYTADTAGLSCSRPAPRALDAMKTKYRAAARCKAMRNGRKAGITSGGGSFLLIFT